MPIDVVLRSVPLHLTDAQLCALLGVETVTRFRRTSGPSEKQNPLHLVRACCRSESQAEQLLLQGRVSLDGQECAVERPKAASDSSAATGKRPATTTLEALLESFPRVGDAVLVPAAAGGEADGGEEGGAAEGGMAVGEAAEDGESSSTPDSSAPLSSSPPGSCCCCRETDGYRRAAASSLRPDDLVLEIGSDRGATCAIAAEICGGEAVVGVDLSNTSVEAARAAHPSIRFEKVSTRCSSPPRA